MALRRSRDSSMIWPGFVDAVTALLMVLMFVLTIFTVMQSVLRETITTQGSELDELTAQVAGLADALGLERGRVADLETQVGSLQTNLSAAEAQGEQQSALIATLSAQLTSRENQLANAQGRVASFEAQVATLLAERDAARGESVTLSASLTALEDAQNRLITEKEALDLALASARDEIDLATEAARLAAARREALDALIADLRRTSSEGEVSLAAALASLQAAEAANTSLTTELTATTSKLNAAETARLAEAAAAEALRLRLAGVDATLTEAEKTRLTDLAAAEALRERLQNSDTELTAMTLALEEQRRRAEETLTLLAAARASALLAENTGSTKGVALAEALRVLSEKDRELVSASGTMELLNQQINVLRAQLGSLQAVLDVSMEKDSAANVQIEALGSRLNAALARVAVEQTRRAELEEAERIRLQAENQDLSKFRSEFFGELSRVLAGREGVRVVGDRFVFSSEVLFTAGSADLAPEGRRQIAGVVKTLKEVADQIPPAIDWIIRVDGHTDNIPLSGAGAFADNWELSQARALSVVRYMQDDLGFPPQRMAATGFGEYRPVDPADTPQARAQNRRIELKLTER